MRVLLVEDELAAARRLTKLIKTLRPSFEIIEQLDSIETTVNWFSESTAAPDLIFMDIHLADGSCFEIFNLVDIQVPIIFTTAYDEYAIDAFRVNAVDYLLKPVKEASLLAAIEKYERNRPEEKGTNYKELAKEIKKESDAVSKRFLIKFGQTIKVVSIDEVAYFYTEDKITFLVTNQGKRYPIDYSLEKLDEISPDDKFFRINRQFIINIDAIKEMYAYSKSRVKIQLEPPCETETIVSTERSPIFKKWLTGVEED
ncbi:MAG: response regulator transcription factor [Saprospiraceae bacterium]|nr:response regulator transcription factor [Saprospiraceae bacterium]